MTRSRQQSVRVRGKARAGQGACGARRVRARPMGGWLMRVSRHAAEIGEGPARTSSIGGPFKLGASSSKMAKRGPTHFAV